MPRFKLHIETDNAAFEGSTSYEVARILDSLIYQFRNEHVTLTQTCGGPLFDVNGNKVGEWNYSNR